MAEETEIIIRGKFENGQAVIDQVKKINTGLKSVGDAAEASEKQTGALTSTLQKLVAIVGITALANQFKNLVKGSLESAGAMEQVNIALSTMLGSADKAKKLTGELIAFAKKTPFEIEGIFSSTKQLLAYGIAQEEIISTMSTLGNIAAGVGVDMNRLALVYGQVKTTGHLMGQDLNQFTQAGVPLLAELAKTLGKTEAEIAKMKESGDISFGAVKAALESMTAEGGRFFNLMESQSKTFLGTVSNMSDSFYQVKVALGDALLPVAKEVVASMIAWFGELKIIIENNKSSITAFANALMAAFSAIGTALGFAFAAVANFIRGIKTLLEIPLIAGMVAAAASFIILSKGLGILTIAFRVLTTTSMGWISAVVLATTAIGYFSQGIEKMPSFVKIAALQILKTFEGLKLVIFDFVESVLDKLSTLSGLPMFGWVDDAKKKFSGLRNSAIADIEKINDEIKNIKSAPAPEVAAAAPIAALQAVAPAAGGNLLETKKAENQAIVENQQETDAQLLANQVATLEAQQLNSVDYAAKKQELDNQLIADEISADQYKAGIDALALEAKNVALQMQYESEAAKMVEHRAAMTALETEITATEDQAKLEQLQTQYTIEEELLAASQARMVQIKTQMAQQTFEQKKATEVKGMEHTLKMDSDGYKAAQGAANELVALQNSKNKSLAAIGKAAAIFQITNDTARGAMSAYASLAGLPVVGPALGAAAAAAVIAYGAERIAGVAQSFAVGAAEIPQDQTANIHAGEMIIPATFAESIRAGDLTLGGGQTEDATATGAPVVNVINVGAGETQGLDIGAVAQDRVAKTEAENAEILAKNAEFMAQKQTQENEFALANPSALNTPIDQKIAQIDASNQVELAGLALKNAGELAGKIAQDTALLKQRQKNDKENQDQDKKNEEIRRAGAVDRERFEYDLMKQASKNQAQATLSSIQNDAAAGAQAAYRAMASIPYVGPALGAAAAAQVMAYSQQRKAEVNSFAVGTASVPKDMLAEIHKNEMIVPATFSEAILAGDLQLSGAKNKVDSQNGTVNNFEINFSFSESNFVENRDDFIAEMTQRMAQLINENVIPSIPTRTAA